MCSCARGAAHPNMHKHTKPTYLPAIVTLMAPLNANALTSGAAAHSSAIASCQRQAFSQQLIAEPNVYTLRPSNQRLAMTRCSESHESKKLSFRTMQGSCKAPEALSHKSTVQTSVQACNKLIQIHARIDTVMPVMPIASNVLCCIRCEESRRIWLDGCGWHPCKKLQDPSPLSRP